MSAYDLSSENFQRLITRLDELTVEIDRAARRARLWQFATWVLAAWVVTGWLR